MFQPGNKLGKGRPKGAKNKHSFNAEEIANQFNLQPLEILLMFANNDWEGLGYDSSVEVKQSKDGETTFLGYTITPELRVQAAKDACKYLYSAKQSVQVSTGPGGLKMIVEDWTKGE